MGDYQPQKVKLVGTNDYDVATALAYLSGFREGTVIRHRSPGDHEGTGRTVMIFHKDTVAKDPDLFLATQAPDILVSRFLGDEYLVEFNGRIEPGDIGKLEEEIHLAYSGR